MIKAYLDNNATTKPDDEVVMAMMPYLAERFLNASSAAADILENDEDPLEDARQALTALLGAGQPDEFIVTSGASEANSWVISLAKPGDHIVTTSIEHPSLQRAVAASALRGVRVDQVDPDENGRICPESIARAVEPRTRLLSVILANNETGVVQPLAEIIASARAIAPDLIVHTDATQAVGRIAIDLGEDLAGVDLLSVSAHKLHGPKGIGALFARSGVRLEPLIHGEQENGWRGGTSNQMAAAGMAAAVRLATERLPKWQERVVPLRLAFERECLMRFPDASINGEAVARLPNTVSLTLPGIDASDVVEQLAMQGICISTGAACNAGARTASPVLLAMGLSPEAAEATIRVSMSVDTRPAELELLLNAVSALRAERG